MMTWSESKEPHSKHHIWCLSLPLRPGTESEAAEEAR